MHEYRRSQTHSVTCRDTPQATFTYFSLQVNAVYRGVAVAVHKQLFGAIGESWVSSEDCGGIDSDNNN